MSAYIVSPNTIDFLVSFAADRKASYYHDGELRRILGDEQRVAQVLFNENARSVGYRYRTDDEAGEFTYQRYCNPQPMSRAEEALTVLKCCNCLAYQSCECPDYRETEAHAIVDAIRQAAIRWLPGYDEAPWGL
jgi:hypothetical protein